MTAAILKYLKANGEQLDSEISQALNMSMTQLKNQVAQLSASGDVDLLQSDALYRWQED